MPDDDELRPITSDNLPTPQRGGGSRHSPFPEKLGLAYAEVYARGCPEMPCSIFDFIPACVSGLLFCAASTGIIMLNKWIIASMGFRLPMTLSFLGMAFSFVASLALVKLTDWVPRNVDITPAFALRRALPIGVLIAATLYFGNLAYIDLSVSFMQMLKASTPIVVLILMYAAGLEAPSLGLIASVLVIALGTLVAAFGEVRFAWPGFLAFSTSQLTEASKLVLMQLLMGGQKLHAIEGLLCFSPFAMLSLAIGVVFVEWDELVREGLPLLAAHPLVFFGQAALGFAVNLLTILVVKFTSSISFKLISMAKNAGIVLLSVPLFHNPISPTQALGYSITMMGFGWYNYVKMNTIKKPPSYATLPTGDEDAAAPAAADETRLSALSQKTLLAVASAHDSLVESVVGLNVVATLTYVLSGVFQPLFVMEMNYSGAGKQLGLLFLLPYYAGMALVLPFSTSSLRFFQDGDGGGLPWRKLLLITAVDFLSQYILMWGLTTIGSGLYTVVYASGPIWTALLAYMLLQRRITMLQTGALLLVTAGLAVVAVGALQVRHGEGFGVGLAAVVGGTALHALVYVLQEMTLVKQTDKLEPAQLCGLIGLLGSSVVGAHSLVLVAPRWESLVVASVRAHAGTPRTIGVSYGGKTLVDFCHGWAYFHLMGQLGATSMSLLKAVVAASSFFASVLFFCNAECCEPREQPLGAETCAALPDGDTDTHAHLFCHYASSQCYEPRKAISLALVLAGVLIYTNAARQRLASVASAEDMSGYTPTSRDGVLAFAAWRWARR